MGGYIAPDAPKEISEYESWLRASDFNLAEVPSPFPLYTQLPYRIVSDAMQFIDHWADDPFFIQVSFPEPHDPEQVPAPYWNMFPPEDVPGRCAGPEALKEMGPRARWLYRLQQDNFPDTEKLWRRYKSNYLGALWMVDDQIGRLMTHLKEKSLSGKTLVVFTADHDDYLMDYGLSRKGVGLYEIHTYASDLDRLWGAFGASLEFGFHLDGGHHADVVRSDGLGDSARSAGKKPLASVAR